MIETSHAELRNPWRRSHQVSTVYCTLLSMTSMSSKYLKGVQLGEGTWGNVFEAERRSDSLKVAIKRIKPMYVHLGMNFTALREIKYLRYIKGTNIIDVRDQQRHFLLC